VALALVFALPAGESAIFLGFVFPGETAAVLAGVLAYEGRVNLVAAGAAVVAGAIVGDTIGYAVGKRWGTRLLEGPAARFIKPRHVDRARAAVIRHGGKTVFLGRFTAALRVLVPGTAGMAGVPYRRFLLFNAAGGVVWGVSFVIVGYLAGAGWRHAASLAGTAGLVALVVVALAVAAVVVVRRRAGP
jgi:membrane protein DedA with SNARE-associated domain